MPPGQSCPADRARSAVTAPDRSALSGSAEIIHPFHPLKGQRFPILKLRRVRGVETLILQGTSHGTFAVPREWTDQADPSPTAVLSINPPPFLDGRCLLQLVEMVSLLKRSKK
ncbi:MAG: DUF5372 family protein [Opitutaceae bacterium]